MQRRQQFIAFLKDQAGLVRFKKAFYLSILGLVLIGVVLGILVAVKISGAEGSDDMLVPLLIVAGLIPVLVWSIRHSRRKIREIESGEIHQALTTDPPGVQKARAEKGRWGTHVFFTLPSGRELRFFMDNATAEEVVSWLTNGSDF